MLGFFLASYSIRALTVPSCNDSLLGLTFIGIGGRADDILIRLVACSGRVSMQSPAVKNPQYTISGSCYQFMQDGSGNSYHHDATSV